MSFYVENESGAEFSFSIEETVERVAEAVLESEGCPYETTVNVLVTDDARIREYNREHRGIDRATDVLSFPNIDYGERAGFDRAEEEAAGCFDPDSGELILGDILLSADRVRDQAREYGHSELREFAFLIAHSMLHLCGYDHMEEEEAALMEKKQGRILEELGITRD